MTMGLFDFLKQKTNNNGQFVSEQKFLENRNMQMQLAPKVLDQLHNLGITDEKELRLEFFFYTSTIDKAKLFAAEIEKNQYEVMYDKSAGNATLFIVRGWTTKMRMSNETVEEWAKQMCELGYKFDCDFDGWGTTPDQD